MIDAIFEKLEQGDPLIIFISILSTLAFLFYKLEQHYSTKYKEKKQEIKEILSNEKSVDSYRDAISKTFKKEPSPYRYYLVQTLRFLRRQLGSRKFFSYKALDKHILFSLIYSFFFFYLIWLFGGNGQIGSHQFIPNENRLSITLYLIFEIVTLYYLFSRTEEIQKFLSKNIPYFSRLSNTWQELLLGVGVVVVGVVGVVVVGVVGVVGVVVVRGGELNSDTILYLLFFLILPFINAFFDYISMYFSRLYAEKILKAHYKWQIFLDFILDLAIATLLFVALAFTLYYVIDFTNINFIKEEELYIPIYEYEKLLMAGNIWHKDVAWITLMFLSTLLPTLLHFALAFTSFLSFMAFKPHKQKLLKQLTHLEVDNHYDIDILAEALTYDKLAFMMKVYFIIGFTLLFVLITTLFIFIPKLF